MEISPSTVIWGLVLPVVIAALLWPVWAVLRSRSLVRLSGVLAAIAPCAAFGLAFWSVEPFPSPLHLPPSDVMHYLFWAPGAVLIVAVIEALLRPTRNWLKALLWLPAILAMVIPLTTSWRNYPGDEPDTLLRSPMLAWSAVAGWSAGAFLIRVAAGRLGCAAPVTGVWILGLCSAFAGMVIEMSGTHLVGTFRMTSLGLSLLPLLALMFFFRTHRELPAPTLTVFCTLYASLILAACLYYALTPLNASLLAVAPILPALLPSRLRSGLGWAARIALTLAPLLLAFILAFDPFYRSLKEQGLVLGN
jgi:hypothetical protein